MNDAHDGEAVARLLIEANCVRVMGDEPFRLPSGWASPTYMDCRRLISFPQTRQALLERALDLLRQTGALQQLAGIAGGESSGIAFAAWIAQALALPLQYVRKRAVGPTQVEGVVEHGSKLLLVDDLMAAGLSKERFIRALTAKGAFVTDVFVIFDYGTFGAAETWHQRGVRVHALCTWHDVLSVAQQRPNAPADLVTKLDAFVSNPRAWSADHGGIGEQ